MSTALGTHDNNGCDEKHSRFIFHPCERLVRTSHTYKDVLVALGDFDRVTFVLVVPKSTIWNVKFSNQNRCHFNETIEFELFAYFRAVCDVCLCVCGMRFISNWLLLLHRDKYVLCNRIANKWNSFTLSRKRFRTFCTRGCRVCYTLLAANRRWMAARVCALNIFWLSEIKRYEYLLSVERWRGDGTCAFYFVQNVYKVSISASPIHKSIEVNAAR